MMLQKITFAFLLFLTSLQLSLAQEPVNWELQKKYLDKNEFLLEFTVTIDSGWHMYASHAKKYPRPLIFNILVPRNVSLRGDLVTSTPFYTAKTRYRGDLVRMPFYRDTVRFRQRIRVDNLQERPYIAGQMNYESYDGNRAKIGCICYQVDLRRKDTTIVKLNRCKHSFDFCIPKSKRIEYYPLKVVPPQQSDEFVEWKYFYQKQAENKYKIIAEANLEEGYRLIVDTLGGQPFNLTMGFIQSKNIGAVSSFVCSNDSKTTYYSIWKQTLNHQEGTVRLEREVTLVDPLRETFLSISLNYMVCNDFDCYTSETETVRFPLQKSKRRVIYVNQERQQTKLVKTDKIAELIENE